MLNEEKSTQESFNRALLEAIDESFSSLGRLPREAIYRNLETSFQIKREDIPLNLLKFRVILERILGSGMPYMEGIITKRLCEKLHLDSGNLESYDLGVLISELKRQLLSVGESK